MANTNTVCSMCGDIGFPEKLFQCNRCHSRFQHSYCTNYYDERTTGACDWCLSEERGGLKHGFHPKKSSGRDVPGAGSGSRFEFESSTVKAKENRDVPGAGAGSGSRFEFESSTVKAKENRDVPGAGAGSGSRFEFESSVKAKENGDREEIGSRGKSSASNSSKPTGRRYKLLKDVLH